MNVSGDSMTAGVPATCRDAVGALVAAAPAATPASHQTKIGNPKSKIADCLLLLKPRLTALVLLATLAGFFFGCAGALDPWLLLDTILGTALVAAGASALNQVLERRSDALMKRTQDRPLPAGRMTSGHVLNAGALLAIAGMLYLALRVNLEAGLWAALTLALYVFVYTPLKRLTTLNTLVGAVPGALPPLIGFAAANGALNSQAWALFAILFLWQLPHFLAIAWLYRADYKRAGLRMLPVVDEEGFATGRQVGVHSLTLLPVSLLPYFLQMSGPLYAAVAALLGICFFGVGLAFAVSRTDRAARRLFLASVAYLPLLLAAMMFDKNQ